MYKVCKIRIYPNKTQERLIQQTLGACRWIYNQYLGYNKERYAIDGSFTSGYSFSKIVTQLKKSDEKYYWLNEISSKAIKNSIMNAEKAFKNFFKGISRFPRFKSKKDPVNSFFFVKDSIHFNTGAKNIIKIPILKYVRITERHYLPNEEDITSGHVIYDHGKYFVSFKYQILPKDKIVLSDGIGIDIGVSKYLTIFRNPDTHYTEENFIFDERYKSIDEKIKRIQQIISNKMEINYKRLEAEYVNNHNKLPDDKTKNTMKGKSYDTSNIRKLQRKLTRLYFRRSNYAKDKVNKMVCMIAKAKPEYITIEDLQVKNMTANIKNAENNHHELHDYIQKSMFRYFRTRLEQKCCEYSIELRIADKYFASSKKCSNCGHKNKDLTLENRVYVCDKCGLFIDRDLNAAINLCNLKKYSVM